MQKPSTPYICVYIPTILNPLKKTGEKKNHAHRSEYQQKMEEKKLKQIKNSHHTLIMYAFVPGMNEKKTSQLCTFVIGMLAWLYNIITCAFVGITLQNGTR